jgi:hypothetical protein
MPFKTLPPAPIAGGADLEYPPTLPEPLIVAVLDAPHMEREGRTTAILAQGFIYQHAQSGAEIVTPEGFLTDFASIPQAARFAFPPFGRHAKAAVLHDFLYAIGEPHRKAFADRIFLDAMTDLQVNPGKRQIMYEAVHLFGHDGYAAAEADWPHSWGDWRTGEYMPGPLPARESFFVANWAKPPRPDYDPTHP